VTAQRQRGQPFRRAGDSPTPLHCKGGRRVSFSPIVRAAAAANPRMRKKLLLRSDRPAASFAADPCDPRSDVTQNVRPGRYWCGHEARPSSRPRPARRAHCPRRARPRLVQPASPLRAPGPTPTSRAIRPLPKSRNEMAPRSALAMWAVRPSGPIAKRSGSVPERQRPRPPRRRDRHASGELSRSDRAAVTCAGLVELRGIEPLTSAVRLQRSPI
jgi:hypothetical protein